MCVTVSVFECRATLNIYLIKILCRKLMINFYFHVLQAKGNRLDRKIGNVLKDQDMAFSFRPKDKDLDAQKLPFQVRYQKSTE